MMITRSKRRKAMTTTTNLTPCLSQDLIFFHILPRLPAKSLLKFTCVSKLWYNWIHDPNFIASHYNLSKSNPSLVAISVILRGIRFMYLDQGGGERDQGGVSSPIVNLPNIYMKLVVGCINGLTCIRTRYFIEICNFSTREMLQIPLPKCTNCGICSYGFGFDPSVNEYKVLQIVDSVCKIYTVGAGLNSTQDCIWRDITVTSALPQEWGETEFVPFIFSSGALFKVISRRNLIITFDIHYEKFQVIPGAQICCDQSYLNSGYRNKKLDLYSMSEFQECPCAVYCTVLEDGYEFHLYALKQQQQQQSSNSCWLIKDCSHFVFKQAICIPFKPDSKLIRFVEFSGQIFLLWSSSGDGLINVYNPYTRWLQKEVSGLTPAWYFSLETVLFVRYVDNLQFLRTLVPLLPLGAPEFKYVSSRDAMHDEGSSTQESKRYRPSAEERQLDMNQ